MRKNLYEAFTLVEMLIVMGILIILMAVGITAGRFAINRANDVAHQNAVDQIYTALQAYYTDNRKFPELGVTGAICEGACDTLENMILEGGALAKYLDNGAFNGGTEATYYYSVGDSEGQVALICVSKGGIDDGKQLGIYCNGNGFGSDVFEEVINQKDLDITKQAAMYTEVLSFDSSDWNGKSWDGAVVVTP